MNTFWMIKYLFKRFPIYVMAYFINEVCFALPQYVGNVLLLKYLMQSMIEKKPISEILILLMITALFLVAMDAYSAWFNNWFRPRAEEDIDKELYYSIREAVRKQQLYVYDDPNFYDDMTYVSENIVKDSLALLSYVSKIMAALLNIVLIVNLFYEIGFGVLVISLCAVVLSILFDIPKVRLQNQRKYNVNAIKRKRNYFRDCFFERASFMELKMSKLSSLLYNRYDESIEEQAECEKRYGIKIFILNSLRELLSTNILMNLILISYLLYKILVENILSGSDFIATYNAANVVMGAIMEVISIGGNVSTSSYTVRKYRKFISSKSEEVRENADNLEEIHSIEFKNVSFIYPGMEREVLKKVSFCIRAGEKVAIVGKNGSGKTTLIHILMGLYYPTKGEVLINGMPLAREKYPSYRHNFMAFFQGMKPMEATVAENIALDTQVDLQRVCRALDNMKCRDVFSEPEQQMIGVRFKPEGKILSDGEYQKLMLAHCFYGNKPIIVMDEPSSALDPVAERDFNVQVTELSDEKMVIFVTHRLSTVHMAERILVIDEGKVSEQGTHDELMQKEGVYKAMWDVQLEKYSGA